MREIDPAGTAAANDSAVQHGGDGSGERDLATRAADLSADLYATQERERRKESLEELLGRER